MGILVREDMGILVKIWEYQGRFADTSKDMGISRKMFNICGKILKATERYGSRRKIWEEMERY